MDEVDLLAPRRGRSHCTARRTAGCRRGSSVPLLANVIDIDPRGRVWQARSPAAWGISDVSPRRRWSCPRGLGHPHRGRREAVAGLRAEDAPCKAPTGRRFPGMMPAAPDGARFHLRLRGQPRGCTDSLLPRRLRAEPAASTPHEALPRRCKPQGAGSRDIPDGSVSDRVRRPGPPISRHCEGPAPSVPGHAWRVRWGSSAAHR